MNRSCSSVRSVHARSISPRAVCAALLSGPVAIAGAQTGPYQSETRGQSSDAGLQAAPDSGGQLQPRLEVAAQYVGNINLAADGEPQIDTAGIEVAPGLNASYATNSAQAALDYSLVGRAWEDSDYNDISHRLAANGQWLAVPDWLAIRGSASYRDVVIDPTRSSNYGGRGLFAPANLTEQAAASISPVLSHQLGPAQFQASYRYGRTWFLDKGAGVSDVLADDVRDSESEDARVSLGAVDRGQAFFASANYNWQRNSTGSVLRYLYESASINAGYRVSTDLTLVGNFGIESDPVEGRTSGGLDETWWDAGFIYSPDARTVAEFSYGQRFWGESYFASIQRSARLLTLRASYREMPTVQAKRTSLDDFEPGELPPAADGDADFLLFSGAPFLARNADVSAVLQGSRTRFDVSLFWADRDYFSLVVPDYTAQGASLGMSREVSSNLSADFSALYREGERAGAPLATSQTDYENTVLTLRINRKVTGKITTSAEAGWVDHRGDGEYDAWWVGLRARYTP